MADIVNPTQNVTVFGGDNPAIAKAITSTTVGTHERLDVDAAVRLSPDPYGTGTPVHAYVYDSDADVGDTQASYTVGTGKVLYIYQWAVSDESYGTYLLQIAGVTKDAIANSDSGSGQRGSNQTTYVIPLKATAGQLVRIYKSAGLSNKEVHSIIVGLEVPA